MAPRRRERRGQSTSTTTTTTSSVSSTPDKPPSYSYALPIVILLLSVSVFAVYYFRPLQHTREIDSDLSVDQGGPVKNEVSFQEILSESSKALVNSTIRRFGNPVLGYVTPWNSLGYEMAEKFSSKFTHLSPVWYDLKSDGKKLVLEGRHNADLGWISRVRAKGGALILPRVVLEVPSPEFLLKKKQRNNMINVIINECKEMGYDGIVLESWSRWAAYGVLSDTAMRSTALQFIGQLGKALHSLNSETKPAYHLELIYVIPALRSRDLKEHDFGPADLQQLSSAVDGFSLMTYDFSGPPSPGPNAPLIWIRSCLQLLLGNDGGHDTSLARKIYMGINFYGNDFILSEGIGGGAIIGRDYVSLLEKHKPTFHWEDNSAEHFFVYSHENIKHAVFYPSLMSLSMRLDEARAWGVSLSIWEIGQGLNYFFDLF